MNRRDFLKKLSTLSLLPFFQALGLASLVSGSTSCQPQKKETTTERLIVQSGTTIPTNSPMPTSTSSPLPTASIATITPSPEPTFTLAPPVKADFGHHVVHVHHVQATHWSAQKRYWEYVDQQVVTQMVEKGVTELTGTTTIQDAWKKLLPGYQRGEVVAIKLNFNNTIWESCTGESGQINALPQPVNAVIAGLKSIGVEEEDIWLFDGVNRIIPEYFIAGISFPGVRFFDRCHEPVSYDSQEESAFVSFHPPEGVQMPTREKIADVLIQTRYLINMPILKSHSCSSISLGFKNHLGSIDNPGGLHSHIFLVSACGGGFTPHYSPLIDVYQNPNIRDKTVLIIGDGLFGAKGSEDAFPSTWSTFGGKVPNSLFFSTDPVAIDSVMADFLRSEPGAGIMKQADEYLWLAEKAGLGKAERGDPWGKGYQEIAYQKVEG